MIIASIDFALANTGWVIGDTDDLTKHVGIGTHTNPKVIRSSQAEDLAHRALRIYELFDALNVKFRPERWVIERPHTSKDDRSAKAMGVCCGIIGKLRHEQKQVTIVEPLDLKKWLNWKRGCDPKKLSQDWCDQRLLLWNTEHEADAVACLHYYLELQDLTLSFK